MTDGPIRTVLDALQEHDCKPKQTGPKQWQSKCPAHDDAKPSLSVGCGDDGAVLLKCQAGCSLANVVKAIDLTKRDLFPKKGKTASRKPRGKIVETYDYVDEGGELLYQTVRFEPKDFRQRRPDGKGGWVWNLKGVKRVLYRLREVLAADDDQVVHIVEGERDADRLASLGVVATTCPMGAGKWSKVDDSPLHDRHVAILPDSDKPGHEHADQVARSLQGKAASVKIICLPDLPNHGDVSDWLDAGGTVEVLRDLIADTPEYQPTDVDVDADTDDDEGPPRESVATTLVKLADEFCELWHDGDTAYATIQADGHQQHAPVRSRAFRDWLRRAYYNTTTKAPSGQAMKDAVETIGAKAAFDGPGHTAHVRVAGYDGAYWLDLCDDSWRAIQITPGGWRVVDGPVVRFVRHPGMLALPEPERGGSVDELRDLLNVPVDHWPLVVAWLLQALRPSGPYPVLDLDGEQGSGKSTASRMLRDLIDPNDCALRAEPREQRDLCIALAHSWVQAYDNLSRTPPWLSDALCRVATGGGFATRELYSDDGEVLFNAMRPILVNGIEQVATRPDLLDRSLVVTLPTIAEDQRRTEAELQREFGRIRPRVLGALLDAVSVGMGNVDKVELPTLPRMADFALWVVAGESALGLQPGEFLDAYTSARSQANDLAIESSPVGPAIMTFMADRESWTGITGELLAELGQLADEQTQRQWGWPKTPQGLSGALRRLAPNLRASGIEYETPQRTGHGGSRVLALRRVGAESSPSSPLSPDGPDGVEKGLSGDGGGDNGDDRPSDRHGNRHPDRHHENRVTGRKTGVGDDGDNGDDLAGDFSHDDQVPRDLLHAMADADAGDADEVGEL